MTPTPAEGPRLNILLVDDQPGKLLTYEVILAELGENLLKAQSGAEALELLLKNDVAVVLIDVSMPGLDGFQLASMLREHPRFEKTAIIFVSAIHLSEADILRGYETGAVDYVPVPIVPALLRAKVGTFLELHRKTRELERLNAELEERVAQRTEALAASSARQELLAREVDHRARNALAVVQAIVSLTRADTTSAFAEAVHGRIRALARAHQLLTNSRWEGADLRGVIEEELAPYQSGDRISIEGDPARLSPSAAQMFALAVHELATNAAKYGALSAAEGRVDVAWRYNGDDLEFDWTERGGPDVVKPTRRGFGTTVIEASFASQLGGSVQLDWLATGLVCSTTLPRTALSGAPSGGETRRKPAAPAKTGRRRILVVEDEAIIALELESTLEELGYTVVGPFHSLANSDEISLEHVDAALLDVNVGGRTSLALARTLRRQGVPVIFATGYERTGLPDLPEGCQVVQKPLQPTQLKDALAQAFAGHAAVDIETTAAN